MSRKYLSLFSGIGGLDYGIEAAGFQNIGCIEQDSHACNNLRKNTSWNVYEGDISAIDPINILRENKMKVGQLDLIIGGPPCQSYSKSSLWASDLKRGYKDSRGKLIDQYMRFVEAMLPKVFLIENVPGFVSGKNNGFQRVLYFIQQIKKKYNVEYLISYKVINCAEYGVPQKRERVFIVATRLNSDFNFPAPMFAASDSEEVKNGIKFPFISAGEALNNIKNKESLDELAMGGKWKGLLSDIPPGENYIYYSERGQSKKKLFKYRSRYWTFLLKLSPNNPSWTLQASPGSSTGPFHWDNRRLGLNELARLQTLPSYLEFEGSRYINQRLIGNAVPSAMGELLGTEIRNQIFNDRVTYTGNLLLYKVNNKKRNISRIYNQNVYF